MKIIKFDYKSPLIPLLFQAILHFIFSLLSALVGCVHFNFYWNWCRSLCCCALSAEYLVHLSLFLWDESENKMSPLCTHLLLHNISQLPRTIASYSPLKTPRPTRKENIFSLLLPSWGHYTATYLYFDFRFPNHSHEFHPYFNSLSILSNKKFISLASHIYLLRFSGFFPYHATYFSLEHKQQPFFGLFFVLMMWWWWYG